MVTAHFILENKYKGEDLKVWKINSQDNIILCRKSNTLDDGVTYSYVCVLKFLGYSQNASGCDYLNVSKSTHATK